LKQIVAERQQLVNDFDSHRRHLTAIQGKNPETDPAKIEKLDADRKIRNQT
jgi:hypothetical protein